MEFSSANFMELSVNDVSDLLLSDIAESGKSQAGALLLGSVQDGRKYKLSVILEYDIDEM